MVSLVQFLFIVLLPLVMVAGGLVTLFAVGALFDALEHPDELRARIDGLFRKPPAPARQTAADHYYRPHWRQS
jgi:hypothetical protein